MSPTAKSPDDSPPAGKPTSKAERTQARILEAALTLFRDRGFDGATMRDIAKEAGMSLGAAYYYFDSKDAIIQAYYQRIHVQRRIQTEAAFANHRDVASRLKQAMHLHFSALAPDRKLLNALVRIVADPESKASIFAAETRAVRNSSIDIFYQALSVDEVPEDLRDLGALALWALDMALMLYFTWDTSPDQQRTHKLVDDVIDMLVPVLPLLSLPLAAPLLQRVAQLLIDAQLVPDDEA